MNCKLKLHSQGFYWKTLRALHALEVLQPPFNFFYRFVCKKVPGKLTEKCVENLNEPLEKFKHRYTPIFFSSILSLVALVYKSYFFQNGRFRKLFLIRSSYKRSNFSYVRLLVKMASKTETRFILWLLLELSRTSHTNFNEIKGLAWAASTHLPLRSFFWRFKSYTTAIRIFLKHSTVLISALCFCIHGHTKTTE